MKNFFQLQQRARSAGVAGLATQVASALAMLGLCYVVTPLCISSGGACSFEWSSVDMHEKSPATANTGAAPIPSVCQQCDDDATRETSSFNAPQSNPALPHTSRAAAASPGSSNNLMLVSLSTADRHWCMAEAFNATLEHKHIDLPAAQTAAVVVR